MNENVLIVAAHQDDEVLGCGGTIARHIRNKDSVEIVFFTDGVGSRSAGDVSPKNKIDRINASKNALDTLGVSEKKVTAFNFPDNSMDRIPILEITRALEKVVFRFKPTIVYTHHPGDLNIDHRIAFQAVMTACRPQPEFFVSAIYTFEIPSSTAWFGQSNDIKFNPNYYVNITETVNAKLDALKAYDLEMRPYPHARSIEAIKAMAKYRGSQVGFHFAEAYAVERLILK